MERLIAGLSEIPQLKIYGITDPAHFDERCPTLAVRVINQPQTKLRSLSPPNSASRASSPGMETTTR